MLNIVDPIMYLYKKAYLQPIQLETVFKIDKYYI